VSGYYRGMSVSLFHSSLCRDRTKQPTAHSTLSNSDQTTYDGTVILAIAQYVNAASGRGSSRWSNSVRSHVERRTNTDGREAFTSMVTDWCSRDILEDRDWSIKLCC
jgi:hypothetical protein